MQARIKETSEYCGSVENTNVYAKVSIGTVRLLLFKRGRKAGTWATSTPFSNGTVVFNLLSDIEIRNSISEYIWVKESDCVLVEIKNNASAVGLLRR